MHKKLYVVQVLIILLFLSLVFVSGFSSRSGGAITITNKISDDLYAFGNSVQLLEDVEQDFITAGQKHKCPGQCRAGSYSFRRNAGYYRQYWG
ncbi:MAG: hypothetical protein U5N58_12605 [Actinomycetota bacterium]|nr:hypothetical protein [Actinomycetota bacterium]